MDKELIYVRRLDYSSWFMYLTTYLSPGSESLSLWSLFRSLPCLTTSFTQIYVSILLYLFCYISSIIFDVGGVYDSIPDTIHEEYLIEWIRRVVKGSTRNKGKVFTP